MTELTPATTLTDGDELDLRVRVVNVKPSDHKYYGLHDLVTLEVVDGAGDLPAGLRIQVRRPHDGSTDLRSHDRRKGEEPAVDPTMKKAELLSIAETRDVELPAKATKAQIIELLSA